jgi:hypothetical protein
VALLAWSRLALAPASSTGHTHGHTVASHLAHQDRQVSGTPVASAVHGAWTDAVIVDVRIHNGLRRPVELSPGQFRVRVDDDGPTVSLYSADRDAGVVQAGSTTTMRVSYLVPPPDHGLSLEFTDPDAPAPVRLARLADHHTEGQQS